MKANTFITSILAFLTCISFNSLKAQEKSLLTSDSLDRYINQALEKWNIPGVAVSIVKDGQTLLLKGYGVADIHTKKKVDEETIFPLASISKTITGTAFATLEAEGKLSLNDLVTKWLPQFAMKDKLYERQITMSDVLSHRSGWKTFQGDLLNTESSMDNITVIRKFGNQTPAYPIRTRFGYSNFGFMVAGECIKNITGLDWNTYVQTSILLPLGMTRTYVFGRDIMSEANKVKGHTTINDSLAIVPDEKVEPFSQGGIYASIKDMETWMKVLLNKGNFEGKKIIPESAITKMWQPHTIIGKSRAADREYYFKTYGLGWEIMYYNGLEIMQHNGAYSGVLTSLTVIPKLNLGVTVLTNQDNHMLHETLRWQVIDEIIQKKAPDYTLATIERQNKKKSEATAQPKNIQTTAEKFVVGLDAIVGTYECDSYGKAIIRKEKSDYILSLEFHPQLIGVFSYHKKDQLLCKYNHPMFGEKSFPFIVENGKVKSFTLFVDSFVEEDGYVFKK